MNDCQPGEKCWMSSMEPCRYIARTFLFITIKHLQTNMYSTKTKKKNEILLISTATKTGGGGKGKKEKEEEKKEEEEEDERVFFSKRKISDARGRQPVVISDRNIRVDLVPNEINLLTVVVMQVEEDERTTTIRF